MATSRVECAADKFYDWHEQYFKIVFIVGLIHTIFVLSGPRVRYTLP